MPEPFDSPFGQKINPGHPVLVQEVVFLHITFRKKRRGKKEGARTKRRVQIV